MKMPTDHIREEIKKCGAITFARFMELALYCPETGYYERNQDNVGRRGDFITSVSVGSLFGQLLAFQFAEWLEPMPAAGRPLKIIEAGAHDGKLAADILDWLQAHRPNLFSRFEYFLLEPSPVRQQWQQSALSRFSNVRWVRSLADIEAGPIDGIIFSNELLDAFPVRRFGWSAKTREWQEHGVEWIDGHFGWVSLKSADLPSSIQSLPQPLLDVLPDGYVLEQSPAAEEWWQAAASRLRQGRLMAIDYGYTADEQIMPGRDNGTLRAYHRHQVSDNLLAQPGEQDLTAHVNFTAIQRAGEQAGLQPGQLVSQPQFLTRIFTRGVADNSFAALDPKQIRQFQTLTHPEHFGRSFRVLIQWR